MRTTLLSLFLLCLLSFARAQHKLPAFDYIPQSPSAAAFSRYGDIPVDISTGVPDISVPIYTLNSHGIKVPISISYHASGIKVEDISSCVGLGWNLNVGGVITRTVLGWEDEMVEFGAVNRPRFRNTAAFLDGYSDALGNGRFDAGVYLYYNDLQKGHFDYYSDRFYYSLGNGESGVFRKDFETGDIRLMPYRPLKVKLDLINHADGKIEITAADGTMYYFIGTWDKWRLSKILNSNRTDSVMFYSHIESVAYLTNNETSYFSAWNTLTTERYEAELEPAPMGNGSMCTKMEKRPKFYERFITGSSGIDNVILMDSIVSSEAVVKFSYQTDRIDHWIINGSDFAAPKSRLTKIQVFNKPGNISVKEVNFSHSYFGNNESLTKRLRLDNVQVGASKEEIYSFRYNSLHLPKYNNGTYFNEDFWGYYNGWNDHPTKLYYEFTPASGVYNLFPNEEHARACILEEIKFPTGGKTVFEYESNRVNRSIYGYGFASASVPADGKIGGLRVKKISSYAYEGAEPQVKKYTYEIHGENYYYRDLNVNKFAYTQNVFNDYLVPNSEFACRFFANSFFTTRNVCYARPMGYVIGTSEAPLMYDKVVEYQGDENLNTGKTIYYYSSNRNFQSYLVDDDIRFQGSYWRDWGNFEPKLDTKEEFKNDNGVYKLVRKTTTDYTIINEQVFPTGFNIESDLEFMEHHPDGLPPSAFDQYNRDPVNNGYGGYYFSTIHFSDCIGHTGRHVPVTNEVYDYVDGINYVKTTTTYQYNQYGQQISASAKTSKGDELKTKITYPVDYPNQAPYNTMIARNNISPVVEQTTYKNTVDTAGFLQSTKTNYNYWDYATNTWGGAVANQILPQTVETKKRANDPETRIQYFSYDQRGNPIYVAKENDTRQMYIWSYNKAYPVAQVANVSDEQKQVVSYTSFEDVDNGNWSITGPQNIVDDNTAPTGRKCLQLTGLISISQSLNTNSSYILSYWYKAGGTVNVTANSSILATSQPKNGWIYVKRRITGTAYLSISGAFTYVDEVRLYPESAQMITFAYDPLIGMTGQCDANDRITYYAYDLSGRLTLVKDDNGNVLKKICYNFQGQPDNCGENALAIWQQTGATRCKPCPQNSTYITNILQREERDNNANSDTYGHTRWQDAGTSVSCVIQPGWQNTINTRCVTINNQNTGEQEVQQTDANPCSGSYGQTRWVSAGTNTAACPLPPAFRSIAINKNYYKQNCGAQQIPTPYFVSIAEGAYISSNNPAEANALAEQEAQRRANESGGCTTIYVKLTKENQYSDGGVTQGDLVFRFYSNSAGTPGTEINLPSTIQLRYSVRDYETWDGEITYDYTGAPVEHIIGAGVNNFRLTDVVFSNCSGQFCMFFEFSVAPGRYIIIP